MHQVTSTWPFKVFTTASCIVMVCGLTHQTCSNVAYICTTSDTIQELLIYHDSSITHTLCCTSTITTEPLPEGPSIRSNKTSTGAAFKRQAPVSHKAGSLDSGLQQVADRPHNSGFDCMGSGSWSKALDGPTLSRNAPCTVTMSNCILNVGNSHHKQMFQLM